MADFNELLSNFGNTGGGSLSVAAGAAQTTIKSFGALLDKFGKDEAPAVSELASVQFEPIPREVSGDVPPQGDLTRSPVVQEQQTQPSERTVYLTQSEFNSQRESGKLTPNTRVNIISDEEKEYMARGITLDQPAGAWDRFMTGWFGAGREDIKRKVAENIYNSDIVTVDGNMVRLVPQPDGSKKPMLVNELGFSGADVSEFLGSEILPFFFGTLGQLSAEGASAGAGAVVPVARNPIIRNVAAATGDAMGVWVARNAQIELAKANGMISEEQFPSEQIWSDFSSPQAQEAMTAMIGTIGVAGALNVLKTTYRIIRGNRLPDGVVDHLRNVLSEYEKVNAEKIAPFQELLGTDRVGPTVGQATGDDFVMNLEARAKELPQNPSEFTTDPFRKVQNRDALANAMVDFLERKYGSFSRSETTAQTESLLLSAMRRPYEEQLSTISGMKQSVDKIIGKRLEDFSNSAPTAQDLVGGLRRIAKDVRDEIDEEFSSRYDQVAQKYGHLTGPNTTIASLKEDLSREQQSLLEEFTKGTRSKFLREEGRTASDEATAFLGPRGETLFTVGKEDLLDKTMRPGAILTYNDVNSTLKALRAKRRQIRDSGSDSSGPDVATLDRLIGAYRAQRAEIAAKADDGGLLLEQTDSALAAVKGEVDNRVVREIMKGSNGAFDRQAENAASYIFSRNQSEFTSVTGDVTGQLMGIIRKDPSLLSQFRKATQQIYSERVSSAADHKKFMKEYGGIITDLYGDAPKSVTAMGKAFQKSETLAKEYEEVTKALQEETLLKMTPGRIIETVLEKGSVEDQVKVLSLVENHPDLKQQYLRTYLNGLMTGSVAGKGKGVFRRDAEGNDYIDVGRLREIVGSRGKVEAKADPVVDQLLDVESKKLLEDSIEIIEMTNRGIKLSEVEKYRKSVWAYALQLYLGPLTKGSRFSNAADLYLQRESGRALIKALTDPKEFKKLVDSYAPSTLTERTMTRAAQSLMSRNFWYSDMTNRVTQEDEFFGDLMEITKPTNLAVPSITAPEEGSGEATQSPRSGSERPAEAKGVGSTPKPTPKEQKEPLSKTGNALSAVNPTQIDRESILKELKRRANSPEAFS